MTSRAFTKDHVSDEKRLVRGEQLLFARTCLRLRDKVHHAAWQVLMTAGRSPAGEINAIRELMPRAKITAVDLDPECLEAAITAGADDVVQCDLANVPQGSGCSRPPSALHELGRFDIVDLDLCANPSETSRRIFRANFSLAQRGVFIGTFSYGRDVREVFADGLRRAESEYTVRRLREGGVPDTITGRLCYLFTPAMRGAARSVMQYGGNVMPMCSVLCVTASAMRGPLSFVQVSGEDFEEAVLHPDVAALYDCPKERIEALRRSAIARQAVQTRQRQAQPSLPL